MGQLLSRHTDETAADAQHTHEQSYCYPPRGGGNYFGARFLLGGEKFDIAQPEAFLFGENADLRMLTHMPVPFPFCQTQSTEPLRPLNCLANVRRDSLRLVHSNDEGVTVVTVRRNSDTVELGHINPAIERSESSLSGASTSSQNTQGENSNEETPTTGTYHVGFTIDCDCYCICRVHFYATIKYRHDGEPHVQSAEQSSGDVPFETGANQVFTYSEIPFTPDKTTSSDGSQRQVYPVIIELITSCVGTTRPQRQLTLCTVARAADTTRGLVLKTWKQMLFADGVVYLLQEVYGIENKVNKSENNDNGGDTSLECVICLSELRDTLILPCRHLCVCSCCAETLRYKMNACPVCRAPFRALLQLRALRKLKSISSAPALTQILNVAQTHNDNAENAQKEARSFIATRYDSVPLVEALNGPVDHAVTAITVVPKKTKKRLECAEAKQQEPVKEVPASEEAPSTTVSTESEQTSSEERRQS